jgi:hypothetical protein
VEEGSEGERLAAVLAQRAAGAPSDMSDEEIRQRLRMVMGKIYLASVTAGGRCFGAFQQSCY